MRISGIREYHVRFGFSSARETLRSIEVLLQPSHHAEQMPWIRVARRRLRRSLKAELEHFRFFFLPAAEVFPMLWDGPQAGGATDEIAALRNNREAYAEAVVRRLHGVPLVEKSELRELLKARWYRPAAAEHASRNPKSRAMLKEFVASPLRSLKRFCAMLSAIHLEIVQPVWGSIESSLLEDVAMRRDLLREHGVTALLRTLSPELSVRQGRSGSAEIEFAAGQAQIEFEESSRLELSPSFFCWPHVQAFVLKQRRGLRSTITYPVPPLTARITPLRDRRALAATAAILGDETRLRIIELLRGRDLSTRELAGFLRTAAPVISRHLQVLLRARLLERYRVGYFVMYRLKRETFLEVAAAIGSLG